MPYDYNIINMRSYDPQAILDHLMTLMRSVGSSTCKGDYYCGIATDPDNRFDDHERRQWQIKSIICVIDCDDKDKCCDVEKLMDEEGFDVGDAAGRGSGEDTRYVYLVEKGMPVEYRVYGTTPRILPKEVFRDNPED